MREILFRGKWKNSGEWVYGNLFNPDKSDTPTQICIGTYIARTCYEIDPETVGQFTGLTDKNGKRVFENDIVKVDDDDEAYKIIYAYVAYRICDRHNRYSYTIHNDHNLTVIGNVYDNPELLKGD